MKIEPLIVVKDVQASSDFYQELLGCQSGHGGDEYEMLMSDGRLLLQLHRQEVHEHPGLWDRRVPNGNGVALWFRMEDFKLAVARAKALKVETVREPHVNPNAMQNEFWLRDPDGYLVVICDKKGSASSSLFG